MSRTYRIVLMVPLDLEITCSSLERAAEFASYERQKVQARVREGSPMPIVHTVEPWPTESPSDSPTPEAA